MTLPEFRALNWALIRRTRKRLLIAPLFGVFIVAVNLASDAKYKAEGISPLTGFAIVGSLILLYTLFFYGLNKTIKKNYVNTSALADGMTITLSDASISLHSKVVNSECSWPNSYKKATRLKNWVILSSGPSSAYFLDVEKMEAPATIADLTTLLLQKGIKISA